MLRTRDCCYFRRASVAEGLRVSGRKPDEGIAEANINYTFPRTSQRNLGRAQGGVGREALDLTGGAERTMQCV